MRNSKNNDLFEIIRLSLWKEGNPRVSVSTLEEMKLHAIAALPGSVIATLDLPPDLLYEWKKIIIQVVTTNINYEYVQSQLPVRIPYVILKGTSAAQYYPYPEYRTMGDIDIMTSHENYETACKMTIDDAWRDITSSSELKRGRHRTFEKNGFNLEIHAYFASMNNPEKAKNFDDIIIENIGEKHILPDLVNGLVLLEHINQHLEEGLGLRQIIDWMMFVNKCLPDTKWDTFRELTERTGLTRLAVITTRMCEIYLGLKSHQWCSNVKEELCHSLMDYVLKCGNFGNKLNRSETIAVSRSHRLKHPIWVIRDLQKRGIERWDENSPRILKPFAWIGQGCQVLKENNVLELKSKESKKMNALFKSLGIKRSNDGLVYFENGEYVVKKDS